MRHAAIDVGSNSVLMTALEYRDGGWIHVGETSEVTGLGAGVKLTGTLSKEASERTLQAIRKAWDVAKSLGCEEIRAAGTMALRIAANADEFLAAADTQGTNITIITGDTEAELGFLAVANDPVFAHAERLAIIDPGGHSTELAVSDRRVSDGWTSVFRQSYPIGTLAMKSTVFSDECPDAAARLAACVQLDEAIKAAAPPTSVGEVVTLGATGCNLVSIRESLPEWSPDRVHGATLEFEEISKAVGWLCDMPLEKREAIIGMEPGRAGTLHAGALILERFLQAIRSSTCRVSVRGWRHAWIELGYPPTL